MYNKSGADRTSAVLAATILALAIGLSPIIYSTQNSMAQRFFPGGPSYSFGTISSVQLNKNNEPDWILSGHWRSNLPSVAANPHNNTAIPVFDATFQMVMVNGSGLHRHSLTNFELTKISNLGKGSTEFNGTAAISLKNGPVGGVPVSVKFMGNNTISIWLEPTKIQNHFGNTPIFGTIFVPFSHFGGPQPPPTPMNMR